jgi:hypothetical protein
MLRPSAPTAVSATISPPRGAALQTSAPRDAHHGLPARLSPTRDGRPRIEEPDRRSSQRRGRHVVRHCTRLSARALTATSGSYREGTAPPTAHRRSPDRWRVVPAPRVARGAAGLGCGSAEASTDVGIVPDAVAGEQPQQPACRPACPITRLPVPRWAAGVRSAPAGPTAHGSGVPRCGWPAGVAGFLRLRGRGPRCWVSSPPGPAHR